MEQTFEEYLKQARWKFAKVAEKYSVEEHLELRTAIDSLLIAYDQASDKALHIGDVIGSLATLNEALAFIQQANDEYRTYYSRIDGEVKEVRKLANDLANVIENYR